MYVDVPFFDPERALRHDLARAVDQRWNDRRSRRDGQHEGAFLERPQMIVLAACALGTNDHGAAALDVLCRDLVRLERGLSVVPIDENNSGRLGGLPEERETAQFALRDPGEPRDDGR